MKFNAQALTADIAARVPYMAQDMSVNNEALLLGLINDAHAECEAEFTQLIGIVQRLQPAGSPPPVGAVETAKWIVRTMAEERERLRDALQFVLNKEAQGYISFCGMPWRKNLESALKDNH